MQQKIILLLSLNATAIFTGSLRDAAYTINSLAQVNKELNTLMNNPQFCLQLIKRLSFIFDCSNEEACSTLQTQQAKRILDLQHEFKNACINPYIEINFEKLYNTDGFDINFTYVDNKTPLILAIENGRFQIANDLLNNDIKINQRDSKGNTAFMTCLIQGSLNNQLQYALLLCNLLQKGADPNISGEDEITYKDIADVLDKNSQLFAALKEFKLIE